MTYAPTLFSAGSPATPVEPKVKRLTAVESQAAPVITKTPKENGFAVDEALFFGLDRCKPPQPFCPPDSACREYSFNPQLASAMRAFAVGKNLFLIGPPGSGKTLLARWIANQLGWNFYAQPHSNQTLVDELGVERVQGPDGIWRYDLGKVYTAYKYGGILLLDELPAVKDGGVGKFYYPILNRDPITVMTDSGPELIYPHQNVRVIAAGNHWNKIAGNYEVGEALADRFVFIRCGYLPEDVEVPLLIADAPSVPPGVIRDLVIFANRTREAADVSDERKWSLSTRVLRDMLSSVEHADIPIEEAVELHIFNTLTLKYPSQVAETREIFNDIVSL